MRRLSLKRAEEILAGVRQVRALVVGDLMLDRYIVGEVERISPEAPVPVVKVEGERVGLGGAGNVAANLTALGAACAVVGCVGDDGEGALVLDLLSRRGIDVSGVVVLKDRPTTVKTRIMARHHHVVRVDREETADVPESVAQALQDEVLRLVPTVQGIALEDYNKGVLVPSLIRSTLEAGKERSLPVVVDPKRRRFFDYSGATVFKPNLRELEEALGETALPEDPVWLEAARARVGCEVLLVTLGDRGMALVDAEGRHTRIPAVAREVYDVSGAGDTVTAVVTAVLAQGAEPHEAAILANYAAAVEVGKAGVAVVTPREILHQQAWTLSEEES